REKVGGRVVGQPMVLTLLIRALRLQEETLARDDARAVGRGEPLANGGLDVVPPLVGGVDAPEAHAKRELGEDLRAVFLPRGAVEEIRNGGRMMGGHGLILP